MSTPRLSTQNNCAFFAKGRCKYGEQCKKSHAIEIRAPETSAPDLASSPQKDKNMKPVSPAGVALSSNPTSILVADVGTLLTVTPHVPTPLQYPASIPAPKRAKRGEILCLKWKKGACSKGDKCFYSHGPVLQRDEQMHMQEIALVEQERTVLEELHAQKLWFQEQLRLQEEARRKALKAERERLSREQIRIQEERRKALEAERARRAEESRKKKEMQQKLREEEERRREEKERSQFEEEAHYVLQQVVQGSIVTFSSGLEVVNILTGFESCRLTIKNLPADAHQEEVEGLFAQQGLDKGCFHLAGVRTLSNGKKEAEVITDSESGAAIAAGLNDVEFRNEKLGFSIGVYNGTGGMGPSTVRDIDLLIINFRAPSSRYIAEFPEEVIESKIRELNGRICAGRQVKVERNTQPPGTTLYYFRSNTIKIQGLPVNVDSTSVAEFVGCIGVQKLKQGPYTDLDTALQQLRAHVDTHSHNRTVAFDVANRGEDTKGVVSVNVRLESHEVAREVHESLNDKRFSFIGSSSFWLRLNDPLLYTIHIPWEQYRVQRSQWDELRDSIKDRKACNLRIQELKNCVRIQVAGNVKAAIGALKVRVENLVSGERVDGWHQLLAHPVPEFMQNIQEAGAFFKSTPRTQTLTLYGKSREVSAAREIVVFELERLASLDYTAHLPRLSVGFFVRKGLTALREMFGEGNAQLDATNRTITIRGPEEAHHQLRRLIEESKSSSNSTRRRPETESTCPICMDTAASPYKLGCGHIYCTACLRHLLTSAADVKVFPIKCDGDESRCGARISIPVIRKFLPLSEFERLVAAIFDWHISQHPHEFKNCKTPSCTQVFRISQSVNIIQCPSCFVEICSSCGEDGHQGMTCDEYKRANDPSEQEKLSEQWLSEQAGIKKCPTCTRFLEKVDGCNRIECPCGAHICWVCMGAFPADGVYPHLNAVHGGFY